MLRRLQAFLVLGVCAVAVPAAAQPLDDEPMSEDEPALDDAAPGDVEDEPVGEPESEDEEEAEAPAAKAAETPAASAAVELSPQGDAEVSVTSPTDEAQRSGLPGGWRIETHGYFRAPMAVGLSHRPNPETKDAATNTFSGEDQLQISYGPTRTIDSNYYSFAYTRLQEQDWAELTFHAKKDHVDAAIGWMGYWFQGAGFRNPDAAWSPAVASLALDSDLELIPGKTNQPNIKLTMGAFWPGFGYFEKYDTFTLGRFRHVGEQLQLSIPVNSDVEVTLTHGFGTSRDGKYNFAGNAPYQGLVGLDLIHYENISFSYGKTLGLGLHYNSEWSRDPFRWQGGEDGKNYADVRRAHLTTVGGEASVFIPRAGRLWVSPSYIHVRNGWALDWAGTEVMHSIGGRGIADNYLVFSNDPGTSSGSGSMANLGFLYENTLSNIKGEEVGASLPEVTFSAFGLFTEVRRDLPEGSIINQDGVKQFKYGADLTLQALNWLGVMLRYDEVNYDMDNGGYVFSAISPRVIFSSHFLSSERIYVQYSRYRYGDNMTLVGRWPWGTPLVPGSDIVQTSRYDGQKPDMDVIRIQASVAF